MPTYDDLDEKYEYLDLSGKNMTTDEIKEIFDDLVEDTMIKHINFSDNLSVEVANDPDAMNSLFASLVSALEQNDCLVALDWAGNHLGDFGPHPANQHTTEYIVVLAKAIFKSGIRRVDLSDNMLTGKAFRKFTGLSEFVRACIRCRFEVFRFRKNGINSLGLGLFSGALGMQSSLIELDLSDNHVGRDALGRSSSEGMNSFCVNLAQTHSLKKLRLAGNFLHDEEIIELSSAIARMPNLSLLDLSNNEFRGIGMEYLKGALISHGSFFKIRYFVYCSFVVYLVS
jgi:Ran GTPase-activating protein (RanGAP) involved in mRNA processing and transport